MCPLILNNNSLQVVVSSMSHLGFSLFGISIKRTAAITARWTGLRNISSGALSLRCCFSNCPCSSADLNPFPFLPLGPPEIPHSTVTAIPSLVDAQDFFFDEKRVSLEVEADPCFQFYKEFREMKSLAGLMHSLEMSWYHCPLTTLKLICLLRNTNYLRNQRREEFYFAAIWLHHYHPKTLACNLKTFAKFACLKDLLEILFRIVNGSTMKHETYYRIYSREELIRRERMLRRKAVKYKTNAEQEKATKRNDKINRMAKNAIERYKYDPKYRFLYDRISDLFVELLKADLEHLNSGRIEKISLASKWCPSLYSSYDRSTLFCESVARRLFPYDSCPEYKGIDEDHYVYRVRNRLQKEVLVPLRKALELPEIYMSANQWNLLRYDRISSIALRNYRQAFFKHDRERYLQYLQNVQGPEMPKTTAKDEAMREKFERNGYVMPETLHWDVSNHGPPPPVPAVVSLEGGLTHISSPSKKSFRVSLEGDVTLNLRAMMESEICSVDDPELFVYD